VHPSDERMPAQLQKSSPKLADESHQHGCYRCVESDPEESGAMKFAGPCDSIPSAVIAADEEWTSDI